MDFVWMQMVKEEYQNILKTIKDELLINNLRIV